MGQPNSLVVVLHTIKKCWLVCACHSSEVAFCWFFGSSICFQKFKSQSKEIGTCTCFGVKAYFPQDKTPAPLSLLYFPQDKTQAPLFPTFCVYANGKFEYIIYRHLVMKVSICFFFFFISPVLLTEPLSNRDGNGPGWNDKPGPVGKYSHVKLLGFGYPSSLKLPGQHCYLSLRFFSNLHSISSF
jgi:hypothetical protein